MEEQEVEISDKIVEKDNDLKQLFLDYVGTKLDIKDGSITVEMCVECLAKEFPDFILLVAQENYLRGYQQALYDSEEVPSSEQTTQSIS